MFVIELVRDTISDYEREYNKKNGIEGKYCSVNNNSTELFDITSNLNRSVKVYKFQKVALRECKKLNERMRRYTKEMPYITEVKEGWRFQAREVREIEIEEVTQEQWNKWSYAEQNNYWFQKLYELVK